ncbi:hypothetical protein KAH94_04570 [bacterium]|nr:hypothetical protein [bacterium]
MNIIKKISILFVLICSIHNFYGQIGCMDNSHHLKTEFDSKTYHYVQCNCECSKYKQSSDRGICSNCKHYHEPINIEIVNVSKKEK